MKRNTLTSWWKKHQFRLLEILLATLIILGMYFLLLVITGAAIW
ncbi:MAG: hypothetical protein AAF206_07190 [Bacteroidota bacterium]